MGVTLEFDLPPSASLASAAMTRGRKLTPGATIPRIEASARRLAPDLAAYARVCGFAAADPLPITSLNVLARGLQFAVMTYAEFPLPLLGIVHTWQSIRALRPVRASESLSARCWVEGHRVARKGVEFELHTSVSASGEAVWSAITTILSRAAPGDGEKRPRPQDPAWSVARSTVWSLPADLGRRYAAVSGDSNPIHLWPLTARLFGFKRPIAHGWWALARALAEMDTDVPGACVVEARFLAPLSLPGRATFASGPLRNSPGHRFEIRRKEACVVGEVRPLDP